MDNIDEYVLSFQNYSEGNYEYETGDILKHINYATKEFPKKIGINMAFLTFLNYYNYGKRGSFEPSIYK